MSEETQEQPQTKPDSEQVKEVKADLEKYKALEVMAKSKGGQILIESLKEDIAGDVETIMSLVKGPEMDLRCAVIKLKSNVNLLRVLRRSEKNAILAQEELSKLIEEEKD